MIVQPNARMPVPHYHESWDETIVGLMGVTTWRVDGKDIELLPGQSLFIKRGMVHGFRNDSAGGGELPLHPHSWRSGNRLLPRDSRASVGGAPDPAKMKEIMLRYGLVPAPGA